MAKGQTVHEVIAMLKLLEGSGIIFTEYSMTAQTEQGSELELDYDVANDARFKDDVNA